MTHLLIDRKEIFLTILSLSIIINSCNKNERAPVVAGNNKITRNDISNRIKIEKIYDSQFVDTTGVIVQLIRFSLSELILNQMDKEISLSDLKREAERIDENTKMPGKLNRIKKIFKKEKEYLNVFVKPVLVEKTLQKSFLFDTVFQKKPYNRIKKTFRSVNSGIRIETSGVDSFTPDKDEEKYYEDIAGTGIRENRNSYYFILKKNGKIKVYLAKKRDFNEWFRKKTRNIEVTVNDKKLKSGLLRRIRGSAYWEEILNKRDR